MPRSSGARRVAASLPRGGGAIAAAMPEGEEDFAPTAMGTMPFDAPEFDDPANDDGIADLVDLGEDDPPGVPDVPMRHTDNLLPLVSSSDLAILANDLMHEITAAARSRQKWLRIMNEGVRRLGFDRTSSGKRNTPFPGSSDVTHPAFAQACIDLQARLAGQLCPPSGPAKTVVVGDETKELADRAERISEFMNYQCTTQIPEWRAEKERALMMVGPEGSVFFKQWYDRSLRRPRVAYIPAESVIMPYEASDHMTSPLVAEVMRKLKHEVLDHIESGEWAEHPVGYPEMEPRSLVQEAADAVTGLEPSGEHIEHYDPFVYFECQVTRSIPGIDGGRRGEYLITLSKTLQRVVAIRRNWADSDPLRRRRRILHHYKAFPWRGCYGIGLYHLIGGLSIAATGALRAILDSAHWVNAPGGYRLKGTRQDAKRITRAPGDVIEIEAPPGITDIREVLMADPHPGPSAVLMQLLEYLTTESNSFAQIALQELAESNANTPVGTTMARLDEGSRVFSAIYQRLHAVQTQELQALHEIDRLTLPLQLEVLPSDAPLVRVRGDLGPDGTPDPGDFNVSISVQPVSDPHTHSDIHRTLQQQARLELARAAATDGVNVDLRGAYLDAARGMHLPDPESLFPEPPPPAPPADPFSETLLMTQGLQVSVAPTQPHDLHLLVHMARLSLPGVIGTPTGTALLAHIDQHLALGALAIAMAKQVDPAADLADPGEWYLNWIEQLRPITVPPADPGVMQLAAVEAAKVKSEREQADIEVDAKKEIVAAQLRADLVKIDANLQAKLLELRAKSADHQLTEATRLQIARESNASGERQKAADIAAKAAEPPRPAPIAAGARPAAKRPSP